MPGRPSSHLYKMTSNSPLRRFPNAQLTSGEAEADAPADAAAAGPSQQPAFDAAAPAADGAGQAATPPTTTGQAATPPTTTSQDDAKVVDQATKGKAAAAAAGQGAAHRTFSERRDGRGRARAPFRKRRFERCASFLFVRAHSPHVYLPSLDPHTSGTGASAKPATKNTKKTAVKKAAAVVKVSERMREQESGPRAVCAGPAQPLTALPLPLVSPRSLLPPPARQSQGRQGCQGQGRSRRQEGRGRQGQSSRQGQGRAQGESGRAWQEDDGRQA